VDGFVFLSFRIAIYIEGFVGKTSGWVKEFSEVKKIFALLYERLDHSYFNDIPGLENPTSEILAVWGWGELKPLLPEFSAIHIHETCTSGCIYRRPEV